MQPRSPSLLCGLALSLFALGPRSAWAAERACPTAAVQADEHFRARFQDLMVLIQEELLARSDIGACAQVALRVESDAVIGVSVVLPDGRTATRRAAGPEDVVPILQALLLVPLAVAEPTPSVAPAAARRRPVTVARPEGIIDTLPSSPGAAPSRFGFELSVISGVRWGDGQFGYGLGVLSFLQLSRWLIGFQGRADGYRSLDGGDPATALELAILAGRRFDLGSTALDLTAGPAVAMKGVAFGRTEVEVVNGMPPQDAPPPHSEPSTGAVPRLLLGARLGFSPRSVFRTFVGFDGELGPPSASVDPAANVSSSTRMPTFTVGLALGATVGAR